MGTNFQGKVEVDQDHQPRRILLLVEDGTAVKGEAQGHVAMIREVLVLKLLAVNHHVLITEILVDGTVKYITDDIVVALVYRVLVPVPHEFGSLFVSEHCVEQRFDSQVLKFLFWDTRTAESRLFAVRASTQIFEVSRKAAASLVAAINCVWLHARQRSDLFLGPVKGAEGQLVGECVTKVFVRSVRAAIRNMEVEGANVVHICHTDPFSC